MRQEAAFGIDPHQGVEGGGFLGRRRSHMRLSAVGDGAMGEPAGEAEFRFAVYVRQDVEVDPGHAEA